MTASSAPIWEMMSRRGLPISHLHIREDVMN
jgi:hypothetical protein